MTTRTLKETIKEKTCTCSNMTIHPPAYPAVLSKKHANCIPFYIFSGPSTALCNFFFFMIPEIINSSWKEVNLIYHRRYKREIPWHVIQFTLRKASIQGRNFEKAVLVQIIKTSKETSIFLNENKELFYF